MDLDRYLDRIGYAGPLEPSPQALDELQRSHLLSVPFESLDPHLGVETTVEPEDAYRKVVEDRRGGFCYEVNGLLAWALEEMGYRVTRLAATPAKGDGTLGPPFAHLTLLVELNRRWLVDVGFGSPFMLEPMDLDERAVQVRGGRPYRIREDGEELVVEELETEDPNAYHFTLEPRERAEFADQCRTYSTDPDSSFVRRGVVAITLPDGWMSMTRTRFRCERSGEMTEYPIDDYAMWRSELQRHFGIAIDGTSVKGTSPDTDSDLRTAP